MDIRQERTGMDTIQLYEEEFEGQDELVDNFRKKLFLTRTALS